MADFAGRVRIVLILLHIYTWSLEAAPAKDWKNRMIYQVITDRLERSTDSDYPDNCSTIFTPESCKDCCPWGDYCGGTFNGIRRRLDYIQDLGFDAIWMSPLPTNTMCGYHGYWAKDLFSVNEHWGSADDFRDLVKEAHRRDIWIMLDIVPNHMGNLLNGTIDGGLDAQEANGFPKAFQPFNTSDCFHSFDKTTRDWNKNINWTQVTETWQFAVLPDLNQSNELVSEALFKWLDWLVDEFNIDGIRIDTVPYVPKSWWKKYSAHTSKRTFSTGEVNTGGAATATTSFYADFQEENGTKVLDSVLNFPAWSMIRNVFGTDGFNPGFGSGKAITPVPMTNLSARLKEINKEFADPTLLVNFVDNHDFARFLSYRDDATMFKNALAVVFGMEGIPVLYYGSEILMNTGQHKPEGAANADNANRFPLWMYEQFYLKDSQAAEVMKNWTKRLTNARKSHVDIDSKMVDHFVGEHVYAFLRGQTLFVTFNDNGTDFHKDMTVPIVWSDNVTICNLLSARDECLSREGFAKRFCKNSSTWAAHGLPQIWAPARKATDSGADVQILHPNASSRNDVPDRLHIPDAIKNLPIVKELFGPHAHEGAATGAACVLSVLCLFCCCCVGATLEKNRNERLALEEESLLNEEESFKTQPPADYADYADYEDPQPGCGGCCSNRKKHSPGTLRE